MRLVVAMTGATGAIYGIKLLEALQEKNVETHLVLSSWAKKTIEIETDYTLSDVEQMVFRTYDEAAQGADISSGSFLHQGMVVLPCSMKTLAGIACGYSTNLIQRAADVTLKEQRKLVLSVRETPLNAIHLENMTKLARLGVCIMPPMPAFYNHPQSLDDLVNHHVSRILDQFHISNELTTRWEG